MRHKLLLKPQNPKCWASSWMCKVSLLQKFASPVQLTYIPFSLFREFYLFIFRQRGREGEREGEKHQCVVASCVPPTGDLAHNPGTCPDWELNQWLFGSQASTQSTEPHQPGPFLPILENPNLVKKTTALPASDLLESLHTELCQFISGIKPTPVRANKIKGKKFHF